MVRETKVGLLVGMCVILLIGIIVSDHLSVVQHQEAAPLTGFANRINAGVTESDPSLNADQGQDPAARTASNNAPVVPQPGELDQPQTPPPGVIPPSVPNGERALQQGPRNQVALNGGATPPQAQAQPLAVYTVKHGDTLYKIAQSYYHRADQWSLIRDANLTTIGPQGRLSDGIKLTIPALPGTTTTTVAVSGAATPGATAVTGGVTPATQLVEVKAGDTLATLAARYLSSKDRWPDILSLNHDQLKRPQDLKIGMKLRLPDTRGTAIGDHSTTTLVSSTPAPGSATPAVAHTYAPIPAPGAVAKGTGSSSGSWVIGGGNAGGTATPAVAVSSQTYTVQPGDTLTGIAARTLNDSSQWTKIYQANQMTLAGESQPRVGQLLIIPVMAGR